MKRLWFALAIALSAHMVLLYFLPSLLVKRPDPAKPETKSNIRSVMITMSYRAPEILKKAEPEKEPVVRPVEKKAVPPEKTQKIPSPILKKEEKIGPQVVQKKPALPLKKTVKQKKEPPKHATEIKPPKKTLPPPPEPEQLLPTKPQTEKTQPQKTLPEPPRPAPPEPPQTMVQDPKVKEDIPLNTTPKPSEKTILPPVKKSQKTVDNPIQTIQTTDPEYRNNPSPSYPKIARKRGYEGLVELLVLISIDGRASRIKVQTSTGHKALDQQAIKTIKKWRFEPRRDNGLPVETWVMVPVRFKLY